jgi:uncharacterized protein YggE
METTMNTSAPKSTGFTLRFDYRILIAILLLVIIGMLALWRPWSVSHVSDRTIEATGDAKLTATPDEYTFSPSYEFKNSNKQQALAALTAKSDKIVAKLKSLGVADSKIKTNSSGYDYPIYYDTTNTTATYTLSLTITIDDKSLAQKVQDYLVTTAPTGAVSPQVDFSDTKRKQLENAARDQAEKDARSKAQQSAKNLGFKLGAVKAVKDSTGFDNTPYPLMSGTNFDASGTSKESLPIQPGENDLSYSVTVTYYVR